MNYTSKKVKDAMRQISQGEVYLPAIQRKFVWGPRKIEALFDSIMRGYPIGTFLFWFVEGATKNEYTFYRFIQDYHEKDNAVNEVAPKPHLADQFIGVLDGQQRLNSMYVALQGSYAYRRKHGQWSNPAAFPQRWLYLNLFYEPAEDDESGVKFKFSFLTKEEAAVVNSDQYWFKVKDTLDWDDMTSVFGAVNDRTQQHPEHGEKLLRLGAPMLTMLWQRLCSDDVISYFSVKDQELDHIVDIFIRVNSTGVPLSRTDLLFSSIVAHWDEGRAQIEEAIRTLNAKGAGFSFDNDFIMRSCLALTDVPVQLKVNSFRKENIERIREQWPQIRAAMEAAADLLVEWGFSRETLPTQNVVVPIAYFVHKGGNVEASKGALRQYLVRALLKQIFRSRTDRVVATIRDQMRVALPEPDTYALRWPVLTVDDLVRLRLPDDRTLRVDEADIEDMLAERKGAYTFAVLSLLYPHLKFDQVQFHQDHIHPYSLFTDGRLRTMGIDPETAQRWQDDRDRLPNLQLMEGVENKSKNASPFAVWFETLGGKKDHFAVSNHIPDGVSLELDAFDAFSDARKALLRRELQAILAS